MLTRSLWPLIIVWGLNIFFFVIGLLTLSPVYVNVCEASQGDTQQKCEPYNILYIAFLKIADVLTHFEFWTAAATVAIACFTYTLKRSTDKLWEAGERQLAVAQTSRRAWLQITDVRLKDQTCFTEEGIIFSLQTTIKNIGETPALSVWVEAESYFSTNNSERFPDAEKRVLVRARARPARIGKIIFPDEVLVQRDTWGDPSEKISNAIVTLPDAIVLLPSVKKKIGFMIFVVVSYRIVGDNKRHITYHPYGMLNVPMDFAITNPGQTVELPGDPFLPGEAD